MHHERVPTACTILTGIALAAADDQGGQRPTDEGADRNKLRGEIERLRSACAVDGGRLNPQVQVGSPRSIQVRAGGTGYSTVSRSILTPEVGARGMVIGSTF